MTVLTGCKDAKSPSPMTDEGRLDLSGYDFAVNDPVNLQVKWECYCSQLFTPEDFKSGTVPRRPEIVAIPSETREKNPSTYRLVIKTSPGGNLLGLYISTFRSAHNIWLNGKLISSNGNPGNDDGTYIIGKANIFEFFDNRNGYIEIVIQASRFSTSDILLGEKSKLLNMQFKKYLINLPIAFIVLFMSFYHFMVYILRRKEKALLYAGIFCFTAAIYISTLRPDPVIYHILPKLSYNQYYLCHMSSVLIEDLFFIFFLNALFPGEMGKRFKLVSAGVFMALMLPLLLIYFQNGWAYIQWINNAHNLVLFMSTIYVMYKLLCVRQKNNDALILLVPFILLFISSLFISSNSYFMKFGWLCFALFLAFRLSLNFTRAFYRVEQLSERLINLNHLKDDFLVNTAHELKTPLHGVIGLAESMLGVGRDQKSMDDLSLIITSAWRLTALVDNILTFSKMKNKDIVLDLKPISMWQVVNVVFAVLKPLAEEKNILLANNIDEQLPNVYADESRLFQIMYNIIGNAVKFTESGGITATAALRTGFLEISVSDTGIGIPSDRIETIITPFEQIGAYENASHSGTGLGLGITRKLVEMHGGKLFVESRLQEGSKFTFTLPVSSGVPQIDKSDHSASDMHLPVLTAIDESAAMAESCENAVQPLDGPVIYIADDDPVNLKLLSNMLAREKYQISKFRNGFELLEYISKNKKPDLVIIDVMMPRLSGYDVCRRLRELYAHHDLPILLLTIKNQPADIVAGFEAGANDYLTKPLHEKELNARVKNLLDLKNALTNAVTAELNFLQAQIKPHFLHNTMNSIMSLVRTDPETARNMLMELSNYLRASFRFKGCEGSIPLEDELGIVKSYLYIMTIRFPGKIQVVYDIDCKAEINVPHLILQPIVENAVIHGVLKKAAGGTIRISAKEDDSCLSICVSDDGEGIEQELIPMILNGKIKGSGIGIINVHKRLLALYGCGLKIESEAGKGTNVCMKLCLKGG
ncbi:MAG: ATP-binding protein [Clostridiaceae bacterium]